MRYDNETGKGDYVHYGELEQRYRFRSWGKTDPPLREISEKTARKW